MYTAPKRFTEDDLNERIPLSIAQWREHVNFCSPPADRKKELFDPNATFGLRGSIVTKEDCAANGGTFRPIIFNWMVQVYPLEKTKLQSGRSSVRRTITAETRNQFTSKSRERCGVRAILTAAITRDISPRHAIARPHASRLVPGNRHRLRL
jgi:hypothetical protein